MMLDLCRVSVQNEGPGGYTRYQTLHIQPWLPAQPRNSPQPCSLRPSSVGQVSLGFACAEDAVYLLAMSPLILQWSNMIMQKGVT